MFATGLKSPDGLAFDAEGRLCVVEESAGRVTSIDEHGEHRILAEGLHAPEGICRGENGALYVVEDGRDGRLLSIDPGGRVSVLAESLDAPEGVFWIDGTLYITESTLQLIENMFEARTRVMAMHREDETWSALSQILERGVPFSFTELVVDGAGHVFVANEIAGGLVDHGLLRLELETGKLEHFASGLVSPEGLCWTPGETPGATPGVTPGVTPGETGLETDGWPLLVAEEDVDGKGHGRISQVDTMGARTTFATGFGTIEDVLAGRDGRVYVSEDSTGLVIVLRRTMAGGK